MLLIGTAMQRRREDRARAPPESSSPRSLYVAADPIGSVARLTTTRSVLSAGDPGSGDIAPCLACIGHTATNDLVALTSVSEPSGSDALAHCANVIART